MKLRQTELPAHHCDLMLQMREMWKEGQLCDVSLMSCDGQTHRCHRNVLSAASSALKSLLGETFSEGQQIQQGEAIEIAASGDVVSALLDHIYGGEPEISASGATELLRLAGAYGLPRLVCRIEMELVSSMDGSLALQLLQQVHSLGHTLRDACEYEIARDFESCVQLASFTKLSSPQLARILRRTDLWVTREEVVFQGLFTWIKSCSDRKSLLGTLLQHIDFRSLSAQNLKRLAVFAQSMGQDGFELQYSADEALRQRQMAFDSSYHYPYRPAKRRCLQHWSPELGSVSKSYAWGRWVAGDYTDRHGYPPRYCNFCWHQGHFYIADPEGLHRWKCGESHGHKLISEDVIKVAVSPQGQIYLLQTASRGNVELRVYDTGPLELGQSTTVIKMSDGSWVHDCCCSPNGVLYLSGARHGQGWVKRLGGSNLVPLSVNFPPGFIPMKIFASCEEVLYIAGHTESENDSSESDSMEVFSSQSQLLLRIDPGQKEPIVVMRVQNNLSGLFVSENGKIYMIWGRGLEIRALNAGETTASRVLSTYETASDLLIQDESLYVLLNSGNVYEYAFPPQLELE